MNTNPIGIFDSGVGGLSVLASMKALLPNETFLYVADQKHNPYGGRPTDEIKILATNIVSFLVANKAKVIVIACNTVSVTALSHLRAQFDLPIVAVVPVVKTLAQKSKTKKAAVFSTPATAKSQYLKELVAKYAQGITIYTVGTSKLEHFVEEGVVHGKAVEDAIQTAITPLLTKDVDSIALGCTHYPFLIPLMQEIVGEHVTLYDSGPAVARRVKFILEHEQLFSEHKGNDRYLTTGDAKKFRTVAEKLLQSTLENVAHTSL